MTIIDNMPPMLSGVELDKALSIFPDYDELLRFKPITERLVALQSLYSVFIPSAMSREIYTKLYLSILRSLQKKQTILATRQYSENSKRIQQQGFESIIGGCDSYTILGSSGIGKTASISRATAILMKTPILDMDGCKLITCLAVQCPADVSIKGLLLEILRQTDDILGSRYYREAIRAKSTLDVLLGSVSQVALNHIALLIIDEVQNVVSNKNGRNLIGTLTQLINASGVSIVMVGTPDCEPFFASEKTLARRSVGLSYRDMQYGDEYKNFVSLLLKYNYTQYPIEHSEVLYSWLYSHTGGNRAVTVQIIHDSQEIAITNGYERLDKATLTQAFENRLTLLHDFIIPEKKVYIPPKKTKSELKETRLDADLQEKISEISLVAKRTGKDVVVALIERGFCITEVPI